MAGRVLKGRSRDSRHLHLRQERGGRGRLEHAEMAHLDSIAPIVGPPPATWTAFGEPLGYYPSVGPTFKHDIERKSRGTSPMRVSGKATTACTSPMSGGRY